MSAPNPYPEACARHLAVGGWPDCPSCAVARSLHRNHERTMEMLADSLAADPNVSQAFAAAIGVERDADDRVTTEGILAVPRVAPTFDELIQGRQGPYPLVTVVVPQRDERLPLVLAIVVNVELLAILGLIVWRLS